MREIPDQKRYPLLTAAREAAVGLVDDRGALTEEVAEATRRFLRRKACSGLDPEVCERVFAHAVGIVREATSFRRSRCGTRQPRPSLRYELLHALAVHLEETFPDADPFLVESGCRLVEAYWDL